MSPDPGRPFTVEPWHVREPKLDMAAIGQVESVFALSNGHIGLRGNLDEGEPHATPGTYLNSFYEKRPLPYAEGGYGYPESGQTIINVTNGKLIRLLVEDEPFDLRYGELRHHERVLDLQAGTLTREVEWASPAGRAVQVRSVRMVSLTQRAIAAIRYEVEVLDAPALLVVQSELVANEQLPARDEADPRVEAALTDPLLSEQHGTHDNGAWLIHQTRQSGLRVAAAMDHEVEGPAKLKVTSEATEDIGRTTVITRLQPGETLTIVKYLAYGWSSRRSQPALHDQVRAALAAARFTGWDGLLAEQRGYLDAFWSHRRRRDRRRRRAPAGRPARDLPRAAGGRARRAPRDRREGPHRRRLRRPHVLGHRDVQPARPLVPRPGGGGRRAALAPVDPAAGLRARRAARPRGRGVPVADDPRPGVLGLLARGHGRVPHQRRHRRRRRAATSPPPATPCSSARSGWSCLVATARLWRSLGHHDSSGSFRIDGVTGPDEYTAIVDNNVYTNLMAQLNLRVAADTAAKHRRAAHALGVNAEEMASWRDAAKAMTIPFDEVLGVHPQSEGFTQHQHWDFENTPPEHYPLLLHVPYFDLYRKQVVKQADLVLAMVLRPDVFTPEQMERNFAYYEAITVRDSSLSACTQAVMAAWTGHLDLAFDYLAEAALVDLNDLAGNSDHGMHIASMAGTWTAVVTGFGGMQCDADGLRFAPRLPPALSRISFGLNWHDRQLRVEIRQEEAEYRLVGGAPMRLWHHGEQVALADAPAVRPIPLAEPVEPVEQPYGRTPRARHPGG